jgi:uncharacterized protein (TIGR02145 family)
VSIKATSTTITQRTPFTFKVNYKDPYTGVAISKTINAVFDMASNQTVAIGNQVWAKNNLDVSRYRNGDVIPQVTSMEEWKNLKTGAWCWYNNDSIAFGKYGKLYNWYAIKDARGIAPEGFHIPTEAEWNTLITYLGGETAAIPKLMETTGWSDPAKGTNSSGFSAKAAGGRRWTYRDNDPNNRDDFYGIHNNANWWVNPQATNIVKSISLSPYGINFNDFTTWYIDVGFSVRLVKD